MRCIATAASALLWPYQSSGPATFDPIHLRKSFFQQFLPWSVSAVAFFIFLLFLISQEQMWP